MAEDLSCTTGENNNPPQPDRARFIDGSSDGDEYVSRHDPNVPPSSRQRSASCDSKPRDSQGGEPRPFISPLVSWDDSALVDKHYASTRSCLRDSPHSIHGDWDDKTDRKAEKDRLQMGLTLRRRESINVFDDSDSDTYLSSRPSSPTESGFEVDFVEKRLLHPDEYFQDLDDLASDVLQKSMFTFYIDGTTFAPFDGTIRFKAPFLENASFQNCTTDEILTFCGDVSSAANTNGMIRGPGLGGHYLDHRMHDREMIQLAHFIECRNIVATAWESVKEMQSAAYCGQFISLLVLDSTRHDVAKLVRIECSKIQQLAIAFEICLLQIISDEPDNVLLHNMDTISNDVSMACRELLAELGLHVPSTDIKDIWRCAVHILDMAVLSYAGAHTQFLGKDGVSSVALPGPFLEKQYFIFRRRSFSCLSEFLAGQEAWVLEKYLPHSIQVDLPRLSLLTDAVTFGDIWGPMWKSYIQGDDNEERILHYNVGNGTIVPWDLPSPASWNPIVKKGEVFCHWRSNKDTRDHEELASSSTLREDDILLIGAKVCSAKLHANDKCQVSVTNERERLRNAGSLSEPGTIRNGRILSAEIFQAQVSPPYVTLGVQREYKSRRRTMKQVLIEDWKHRPENREIRMLEFKLGLEVSTCTHNARRIRLIKLLGSQTMLNHLKGSSLNWKSTECEEKFYAALQDPDHTAFRKLYQSHQEWQIDLGNAVAYCLDHLEDTGKVGNDLELFWAPDTELGQKVTLRSNELSWIGFLEDTESSGTLAVLEDRCLQTSSIGKKCQNDHFDPRHIYNGLSSNGGVFDGSILETSVNLNGTCVPDSIRQGQGLVANVKLGGSPARHRLRWSLSSLEEGDRFKFGVKGSLKAITTLSQGQILAKWSPNIRQSINNSPFGILFDKPDQRIHHECIRDQDENTRPVHFLIISTARSILSSSQPSRRSSLHALTRAQHAPSHRSSLHALTQAQYASSSANDETTPEVLEPRAYVHDPTPNGQPRTMPSDSNLAPEAKDKMKDILYKWSVQHLLNSLESSLQESS